MNTREVSLPSGRLFVKTREIGATDLLYGSGSKAVVERIEQSHTFTRREAFFFSDDVVRLLVYKNGISRVMPPTAQTLLTLREQYDGPTYLIATKSPTAGYSPAALMEVVAELHELDESVDSITTHMVYDYPFPIQEAYWSAALQPLIKFCKMVDAGDSQVRAFSKNVIPCLTGNHSRAVATEDTPSIRTVAYQHDHILFLDPEHLSPLEIEPDSWKLHREQRYFQKGLIGSLTLREFVDVLNHEQQDMHFSVRTSRPFGYETQMPFGEGKGAEVAAALRTHYQVYQKEAARIHTSLLESVRQPHNQRLARFVEQRSVLQPSFVLTLIPNEDRESATAVFIPTLIPWGVLEKSGIELRRGPDYPPLISDQDAWNLQTSLVQG